MWLKDLLRWIMLQGFDKMRSMFQIIDTLLFGRSNQEKAIERGEADQEEDHEKSMEETEEIIFDLDCLVQNPGLKHIAELIFSFLEAKDLAQCRLVTNEWKCVIDAHKHWWILQLRSIKTTEKKFGSVVHVLENFPPNWNEVYHYFETRESLENLKRFVAALQTYCKARTTYGCPLSTAIYWGQMDVVQLYMLSPLDFNGLLYINRTPLHVASYCGQGGIVQLLFDKEGIDLNAETSANMTSFHAACEEGHYEVVEMFLNNALEKGIDLDAKAHRGLTAMHYACMGRYENPSGARQRKVVQLLLDHSVAQNLINPNAADNQGNTPFHMACNTGLFEVVELLLDNALERNINIHTMNIFGTTPLVDAKQNGHAEIALLLMEQLGWS